MPLLENRLLHMQIPGIGRKAECVQHVLHLEALQVNVLILSFVMNQIALNFFSCTLTGILYPILSDLS